MQIHEDHPENIEALQYLEALCKDQGRNHDDYSKKLEKLRRSQPMATQSGAMTRAGGAGVGGGGPAPSAPSQRTERPARPSEVNKNLARVDEMNDK
jgi:hypothetical protein